jgi:uncharacterized MAPEG superfamily protein
MPIFCAGIAKWGFKEFDNSLPRAWLSQQQGYRARANAAQANCFEAFPLFAAAVLCNLYAGVGVPVTLWWSLAFLIARALYIVCYVANWAMLRTVVWSVGLLCNVVLLSQAVLMAAAQTPAA